jgi:hypothetical protein
VLGLAVAGPRAYLARRDEGVQIVDVEQPARPQPLAVIDTPGEAWDVELAGGLAFVADGSAGLRILDVADVP